MYNKTEVIKLSKIIFTPEQIDLLSRNKYVKSVSEKAITYTNEFKIQFIADTNNGKTATQIFSEAGLDPQILGKERIHTAKKKWTKAYKEHGVSGLNDTRRGNCWDNAPQESFFGHMKDEVDFKSCTTFEEARVLVDDYMDYYNNHRSQWNMKKLTPAQYTNQLLSA